MGAGANSHSLLILIDLYLGASLGLQPEGYKWEGRNRRKNKKKRFLEMNVPSWFEREMGFGGSCLLPRPAGVTFQGRACRLHACPGPTAHMPTQGRSAPTPQCPRPPRWAQTHAGLTFCAPLAQWEVGGDLSALLWPGSHRSSCRAYWFRHLH